MAEIIVAIIALVGTIASAIASYFALKNKATHGEIHELRERLEKASEKITALEEELDRYKIINQELQDKNIALMQRFLKELDKKNGD